MPESRENLDRQKRAPEDDRTTDRILAHYELERTLAAKLRSASKDERASLYGELYSELFRQIADHPQNTRPEDDTAKRVSRQLELLCPYLKAATVFVEVGCGDAALSIAVARRGCSAIGMDVTSALIPAKTDDRFRFVLTNGTDLDLPSSSVDLVYSNQLMEHLHPEDAYKQLAEIRRILKPGGAYVCVTPSRLTGPHDISEYFDSVATGFHIQEYDYGMLREAFSQVGFTKFFALVFVQGRNLRVPYFLIRAVEKLLSSLPQRVRLILRRWRGIRVLLGVIALGIR